MIRAPVEALVVLRVLPHCQLEFHSRRINVELLLENKSPCVCTVILANLGYEIAQVLQCIVCTYPTPHQEQQLGFLYHSNDIWHGQFP